MAFSNTMRQQMRFGFAMMLASACIGAMAQDGPETGAHSPAQAAADEIRTFARTDGAFLAAGLLKSTFQRDNLASILQFPGDEIVVLNLTGAQIKQAFERTLSLHPQANPNFLQVSGFEIAYSRSAPPGQRVTNLTAGGVRIEVNRTYTVAMPTSLGRGGFGYFKIWDKANITRTFQGPTVESILRGKRAFDTPPRWSGSA